MADVGLMDWELQIVGQKDVFFKIQNEKLILKDRTVFVEVRILTNDGSRVRG